MSGFEMGGGWFGMGFGWILVIAAVVAVAWLAASTRERSPGAESALDVVKKRYARGEVNREEFEQMKRDLGA